MRCATRAATPTAESRLSRNVGSNWRKASTSWRVSRLRMITVLTGSGSVRRASRAHFSTMMGGQITIAGKNARFSGRCPAGAATPLTSSSASASVASAR